MRLIGRTWGKDSLGDVTTTALRISYDEASCLSSLNWALEEILRLVHEELVQGAIEANVDGDGGLLPPPSAPRLLPQASHRSCPHAHLSATLSQCALSSLKHQHS